MKSFVKAAKALGDPARVVLLKVLERKPLCVCEATAVLGLAQSTVSKHLKVLEEAGLVDWEREGAFVNYRLAAPASGPAALLLSAVAASLEDDPAVGKAREAAKLASRGLLMKAGAAGINRPDDRVNAPAAREEGRP